MKKFIQIFFLSSITLVYADNIVDYYNEIHDQKIVKQILKKKNGKFYAEICEEMQEINVDLKNGYFSFSDDCPGGGSWHHQVALFRDSEKNPYIAISNISRAESAIRGCEFAFFKKTGTKWSRVSAGIKFDGSLFYPNPVKLKGNEFYDPKFPVRLPRQGTDVTVFAHVAGAKSVVAQFGVSAEELASMSVNQPLKYDKVIIGWDAAKALFYVRKTCIINSCQELSP